MKDNNVMHVNIKYVLMGNTGLLSLCGGCGGWVRDRRGWRRRRRRGNGGGKGGWCGRVCVCMLFDFSQLLVILLLLQPKSVGVCTFFPPFFLCLSSSFIL